LDLFKPVPLVVDCAFQGSFDGLDAGAIALHKQLFLVAEVIVKRGLGDFEPGGQQPHRGFPVAHLEVELGRSLQNGVPLYLETALLPHPEGLPWLVGHDIVFRPVHVRVRVEFLRDFSRSGWR